MSRAVLIITTREGVCWHLVARGQGCCSTTTVLRMAPTAKNYPAQNVSSAEVEESWSVFKSSKSAAITAFYKTPDAYFDCLI